MTEPTRNRRPDTVAPPASAIEARASALGVDPRTDSAAVAIAARFARQAGDEALEERRAMLNAAAVEVLFLDRPAVELARAERTLAQLDPVDVRELRALDAVRATSLQISALGGYADGVDLAHGQSRAHAHASSPSGPVFDSLALVAHRRVREGLVEPLILTSRARVVLEVMREWDAPAT